MLTKLEYQQLKKQIEEDRRRAEGEYKKDLEALDRIYRIKNRIASTEEPTHSENNDSQPADGAPKETLGRGDLTAAVKAAVKASLNDFTILTIASVLLARGIPAKKASIRPILARLEEDKMIETITPGAGRRATVYRRKHG